MNDVLDYLRVVGYFAVAVFVIGSMVFMRRVWYAPVSIGLWFVWSGSTLLLGIVSQHNDFINQAMTWFGTPFLFLILFCLMRAYWYLGRQRRL